MSIFEPIKLTWDKNVYEIPADKVLGAITRIEDVLTLKEIHDAVSARGAVSISRVAQAYGTVLRYAGAKVTDEEVYADMFVGKADGSTVMNSVQTLLLMLTPPQRPGSVQPGESQKPSSIVDAPSSPSTTSSSSETVG